MKTDTTPKRDIAAAVSESAHNIVMLMPSGDSRRKFVENRLWLLLKEVGVRHDN